MSDMLEQAIVDAEALREAALKNAEQAVIDKYSNQIKEAVETILEQPELGLDEPELGLDEPAEEASPEVPVAAHEGEDLCPCPDEADEESGEIEIDLDDIIAKMETEEDEDPGMMSSAEVAKEISPTEDFLKEQKSLEEDEETLEEDEEVELNEDALSELVEELTVDIDPQKTGWAGTPQSYIELAEEELLALEQDSKVREEKAAMRKAVQELENVNESLQKEMTELKTEIESLNEDKKEFISILKEAKQKLEQVNYHNAKLLYTNKALTSDSLNERQKKQVVEALSRAETVEEAKIIFETLQSTVGSALKDKQPESLSEAVTRSTSTVLMSQRNRETKKDDPSLDRWKILAGLNKK
jgi:myosin heavy subunit